MTDDQPDVTPEDALQVAQRALAKVGDLEDRVEDQQDAIDDLQSELTAVSLRVSEFDDDREYDQFTRDDKVGKVREYGFRRADEGHGRTKLDYKDIKWSVFEGEPSPAHCYTLMELAASAQGFEHRDPDDGNEHLAVTAAEAKRGPAFYSAKKDAAEEGRSG
ncbi:hypothetical protein [Halosimplex halophilum]|uniref:hypothetical protein n=1 Tax=Halosimplex halophilum TaxID=2559572 RepID=UPI00107EEADF|nr:hypothetical protein [Halosimplex halophilum]